MQFNELLPGILGALYTAVSAALRNQENTSIENPPRMASCAEWVVAAEDELPWEPGGFMEAFQENILDTVNGALDSDPVAEAILQFVGDRDSFSWEGNATALLSELEKQSCVPDRVQSSSDWPKLHNKLTNHLKRIVTFLRSKDIELSFNRTAAGRLISIIKASNPITVTEPSLV